MKIYFIGIGGIGVSALAQYYFSLKSRVSGSDLSSSEIIEFLKKKKIKINIGKHKKENLPKDADLIIYSPAVQKNNPEFKAALELKKENPNVEILSYPEALGKLTEKYFTIAVSGTHGKSTTSSMLSSLLIKAGMDPTVIIGTKLKDLNPRAGWSNFRKGKSKYLVIEADEHFASFLNYKPKIIVLTKVEADHLDYFKNFDNVLKTFKKYIGLLPENGYLVANKDDNISSLIVSKAKNIKWYSLNTKEAKRLKKILKIPGEHNISNALASLTTARILKIPDKTSFRALSEYKGCWRRFEEKSIKLKNKKIIAISDYAHHPTELMATLKAAREKYPFSKILSIYQPHQYQRTYYLFNDFIKSFREAADMSLAEKIIISDIYDVAGREEKNIKNKINSKILAEKTKRENITYLEKNKILNHIKQNSSHFDVLLIMGAGDIYKIVDKLG